MTDIVERLHNGGTDSWQELVDMHREAKDEIERLREENERLQAMLESTIETVGKWKMPLPLAQTGDEG